MHLKSTDGDIVINPIRAKRVLQNLSRSTIPADDCQRIAETLEKMTHSDSPVEDESGSESKDSSRGR